MSEKMKVIAIIPARLASLRLDRKLLIPIHGLPMLEHVRRRALLSSAVSDVYVATCDKEIADMVSSYGGNVIMTENTHTNGTSRVAEAVKSLECSHVILLQGDEPLLLPDHVDQFVGSIQAAPEILAWNITGPIEHPDELERRSFVKCAVTSDNRILYCFRRSPSHQSFEKQRRYIRKMLGMIAYRKDFLLDLVSCSTAEIESIESIEQMRIIEDGYSIYSVAVSLSLPSVNEPGEIDIVLDYLASCREQQHLLSTIVNMNVPA